MQVDVALQGDRTGEPDSLRHDELAAAFLGKGIDGFLECIGAEGRTVADGTEVLQVDLIAWELWSSHFLHLEREILIERIIVVDVCCLDSESQYTGINKTE